MVITCWSARVESKNTGTVALRLIAIGKAKHELAPVVQNMGNGFAVGRGDVSGRNVEWECQEPVMMEELSEPLVDGRSRLRMTKGGYAKRCWLAWNGHVFESHDFAKL